MRTIPTVVLCVLSSGLAGVLPAESPKPGDVIVLEFQDGRQVAGEFSGVEGGERLWLVQREAGIELRSGYNLSLIGRVLVQGEAVSLASIGKDSLEQTPPWKIPIQEIPLLPGQLPSRAGSQRRAVTLDVSAEPANWDADWETDGLRLYLTPRDGLGQPVPSGGQLSVVLESRQLIPGPIHQGSDRAPLVELQRWGRPIRLEDYGPEGLLIELPFDGRRRQNLEGLGIPVLLKARLGIPGDHLLEAVTRVPFGNGIPFVETIR